jgi:hypothetical protein
VFEFIPKILEHLVADAAFVVLDPTVPPVVAVRVGQVDPIAYFLEQVGGPVPAIVRFDNDVTAERGGADLLGELHRFVLDSDRVDLLPGLVHPVDDRPSALQVDAHVLLCHRGLPCREGFV